MEPPIGRQRIIIPEMVVGADGSSDGGGRKPATYLDEGGAVILGCRRLPSIGAPLVYKAELDSA